MTGVAWVCMSACQYSCTFSWLQMCDVPVSACIMDFSRGNIKFVRGQTVLSGLT